uniref:Fido domain-containing protein n=1 Tax=Strigamia maritima TaxID=126957 RepID=T1IZS2_STRMM
MLYLIYFWAIIHSSCTKVQDFDRRLREFKMIYSNYEILEKVWWRASWVGDINIKKTVEEIENIREHIRANAKSESQEAYWTGYMNEHRKMYLKECIVTEMNIEPDLIDDIVDNYEVNSWTSDERQNRVTRKVKNLYKTIIEIFPNSLFPDLPIEVFTTDFAKGIHVQVGNNIIENAGVYRKKYAKPAQEDFYYLAPELIDAKMEDLFRQCRIYFKQPGLSLEVAVKYAACFLSFFLYIHPFTNGNGRVARLLTSCVLLNFTVVPLSLYIGRESRNIYLDCLRASNVDFSQNN